MAESPAPSTLADLRTELGLDLRVPWFEVSERRFGAKGDGVTDDTAAIQAAINAANGAGDVLLGPGTFYLNSPTASEITVPPGASGLRIRGAGQGATTIKLSANTPRFLGPNRTANDQVFQNIEVADLTVDCNNIGGRHHVVLGYWKNGSWGTRVNWDRCIVNRVSVINCPVGTDTAVDFRIGVSFNAANNLADPQNYITNCVVRDFYMLGGLMMVDMGGHPSSDTTCNVWTDNCFVERWYHALPSTPTAFNAGCHVIFGSKGYGGFAAVRNGYGKNSPDVGLEIDSMQEVDVQGVVIVDAWNHAFYGRNYHAPYNVEEQVKRYRDCHAIRTSAATQGQGWDYKKSTTFNLYPGDIEIAGCSWRNEQGSNGNLILADAFDIQGSARATVRDFTAVVDYGTRDTTGGSILQQTCRVNSFDTSQATTATLENLHIKARGIKTGANTFTIEGLTAGDVGLCAFPMIRLDTEFNVTSVTCRGMTLGSAGGTPTIRNAVIQQTMITGGASSWAGVQIGDTTHTTISGGVTIIDSDWQRGGASGTEVSFLAPSNAAKVTTVRPRWKTAKTIATPTVTASPFDYQNLDGYRETVTVAGGTVSLIELADANANYATTGAVAGSFVLDPGWHLRVTYTVAPTMKVIPAGATT